MTLRTIIQLPTCPPDDTEESIVGTGLHQIAIHTLREGLLEAARRTGASWGVGSQLILLGGMVKRDGTSYDPMPDVSVHPHPIDPTWASLSLLDYGPPLLVLEVASPGTVRNDLGDKADAYARVGVAEYLVFDPTGDLLGARERVWARRVNPQGQGYERWHPDERGWWRSAAIDIAFEIQGPLLRVRERDGTLILVTSEERQARIRAEQAHLRAEEERRQAEEERRQAEEERRQAEEERRRAEAAQASAEARARQAWAEAEAQAEQARREVEEERRAMGALEERLARLEAEMRRLRDEPDRGDSPPDNGRQIGA